MKTKVLLILILFSCCNICWAQNNQTPVGENRLPGQKYLEDSVHVFWDSYPNPFSPPGVRDTGKGLICGYYTFYCDLSDTVGIAFVTKIDSVVYQSTLTSPTKHNYSLCYWEAGPKIQVQSLPTNYFLASSDEDLGVLLIVDGRKKNIREGALPVRDGWYYWINDQKIRKHSSYDDAEERIHAHMDSVRVIKNGYTLVQRKYSGFIPLINKLKEEINAQPENKLKIARKYKDKSVDDSARIHVVVVLSPESKAIDTLSFTKEISGVGGLVNNVFIPTAGAQIEITCWIPYDKMELIASMPNLGAIDMPGFSISN